TAHFLKGFGHPDGRFRFRPDWPAARFRPAMPSLGPIDDVPSMPDHWAVNEAANEAEPFKLATSPARTFLNSTFTETPGSLKREGRPTLFVHPADIEALGIADGTLVRIGNERGDVVIHVKTFA